MAIAAAIGYAAGPDGDDPAPRPQHSIAISRLAGELPLAARTRGWRSPRLPAIPAIRSGSVRRRRPAPEPARHGGAHRRRDGRADPGPGGGRAGRDRGARAARRPRRRPRRRARLRPAHRDVRLERLMSVPAGTCHATTRDDARRRGPACPLRSWPWRSRSWPPPASPAGSVAPSAHPWPAAPAAAGERSSISGPSARRRARRLGARARGDQGRRGPARPAPPRSRRSPGLTARAVVSLAPFDDSTLVPAPLRALVAGAQPRRAKLAGLPAWTYPAHEWRAAAWPR